MSIIADSWGSYPSIFTLGHRTIRDLLIVPVNVEEKVEHDNTVIDMEEAS